MYLSVEIDNKLRSSTGRCKWRVCEATKLGSVTSQSRRLGTFNPVKLAYRSFAQPQLPTALLFRVFHKLFVMVLFMTELLCILYDVLFE